jgi:multimeric flavodoxin WrbA
MKIVAFNGSPLGRQSNTNVMVEAFLAGARDAGAETENIFLANKTIEHCRGCFTCWLHTPGTCILSDDMEELIGQYLSADLVVFATPLHNDNVSAMMKDFIDRLLPLGDPHFEKDPNGEVRHVRGEHANPTFFMIANCGFPEQSHFQVLRLLARRMARNYHTEFAGEIYRGAGIWLQEEELKPLVEAYTQELRNAGAEVVRTGRLSPETSARLEQPLIPSPDYVDVYLENMNAYMDGALAEIRKE